MISPIFRELKMAILKVTYNDYFQMEVFLNIILFVVLTRHQEEKFNIKLVMQSYVRALVL